MYNEHIPIVKADLFPYDKGLKEIGPTNNGGKIEAR